MWRVSLLALIAVRIWPLELWAASPECLPLRHDAVTAADLAPLAPAFGTLPGPVRVAWAPAPGVTRWISPGELVRIGHQLGIAVEPTGVCLARVVELLERETLLAAMRAAGAGYEIELAGFGPVELPAGRLEFSARGLPHLPRPALPTLAVPIVQWRGRLVSESGRAFPVWARARVSVRRPGLVTLRPLEAGQIVEDAAIRRVELIDYPAWEAPLADTALAIGRRVRRRIATGSPILPQLLALRRDVERGDSVEIDLLTTEISTGPKEPNGGEASAKLTAQAESPGRVGELILLKNPLTGRRFSSKVTGVGRAEMTPPRTGPEPHPPRRRIPAAALNALKTVEASPDDRP